MDKLSRVRFGLLRSLQHLFLQRVRSVYETRNFLLCPIVYKCSYIKRGKSSYKDEKSGIGSYKVIRQCKANRVSIPSCWGNAYMYRLQVLVST